MPTMPDVRRTVPVVGDRGWSKVTEDGWTRSMLDDLEFCVAGPEGLGSLLDDRPRCRSRPWPVTPAMMRAWRQVNSRMVELYQYMHLIFGTATYAPAAPSSHVTHTAHAIFELLALRQKQQLPADTTPHEECTAESVPCSFGGGDQLLREAQGGDEEQLPKDALKREQDASSQPQQHPNSLRLTTQPTPTPTESPPPEPYLLESLRPSAPVKPNEISTAPQAGKSQTQYSMRTIRCPYHRDEQVSDTSSESESELALADELLGGVIGNSGATRKRRRELMEVQEAEAWRRVKGLLQECSQLDTLLQVTIDDGPNVLLMAVINDDQDVLQLLIREGIDLNQPHCTLPLHLAASLGNLPVVRTLLAAGANPGSEAGMCHPRPHHPIKHVPSRFHFLETDIYVCDSDHQLPLMYALEHDHVETARCLLEFGVEKPNTNWPYNRYPLHYACSQGAIHCVRYLVGIRPGEINTVDEEGMTPLLHAVRWGHALVKFLVESGANVHARTRKGKGALHLLYSSIQNPLELHATTKFLLGTGMEQDVNWVDAQGNSLLHELVAQVNRIIGTSWERESSWSNHSVSNSLSSWSLSSSESRSRSSSLTGSVRRCRSLSSLSIDSEEAENQQRQFDEEVIDTLDLLLSFNCDANIVNNSGVTALHKLLLSLDFVLSDDTSSMTLETLPAREQYKIDFAVMERTIDVLLRHRTNPNALTAASRGPLIIMLQMLVNTDPVVLTRCSEGYLNCLSVLLESGAQPSLNLHTHLNVVAVMTKFGHCCLQIRNPEIQDAISEMLKRIMTLLLRYGLNSNHSTHGRKAKYLECTSGNILLETVKLAAFIRQPTDLLRVHSWVLTLLQGGADPDVEPYPSDPIICHSQGSIFLKPKGTQAVNQYMYDIQDFSQIFDGGFAEMLLLLFFNTMDHEALFQCMNTAKFLSRFDPNRAPSGRFLQLIHTLSSRPRSLKQIARLTIYKSIDRQLSLCVPHLPLPTQLRNYLLNIE